MASPTTMPQTASADVPVFTRRVFLREGVTGAALGFASGALNQETGIDNGFRSVVGFLATIASGSVILKMSPNPSHSARVAVGGYSAVVGSLIGRFTRNRIAPAQPEQGGK